MNKLLSGLLVILLSCGMPAAFAANACTAKTALPIDLWNTKFVVPVECTIDTINTDVTIYTPDTGNMGAIVGLNYQEATAHNIQFTNGSDVELVLERAANTGTTMGIGPNLFYVGQLSAALKFQSSAAISGPMIFYVIQAPRFVMTR